MVFMGLFLWRSVREWTSWEPALGEGDHEGDHCTPVLHTILTGLGSTRQATLLKPGPRKAGPKPGDRMSYLTQLHSFQWGFLGSFVSWQKTDTQWQNGYKWPCSSCVVGRPYSHTETNAPSLRNEVCPGCVYSLGTDEEWVPGNLHSGSSQPGGRISDIHIPIHNGREITVMK